MRKLVLEPSTMGFETVTDFSSKVPEFSDTMETTEVFEPESKPIVKKSFDWAGAGSLVNSIGNAASAVISSKNSKTANLNLGGLGAALAIFFFSLLGIRLIFNK